MLAQKPIMFADVNSYLVNMSTNTKQDRAKTNSSLEIKAHKASEEIF